MYPKYQIKWSSNRQYYWVLRSVNAEVLLTSETYVSKQGCKDGIAASKVCTGDNNFRRYTASNGYQYYFTQIAANGQVLGTSEMYNSVQARENGIAAVKRDAPKAGVEDLAVLAA